jgi:hypothetical protein
VTSALSVYAGHTIVFATMHGKERLAAPVFADVLGAAVIAPDHLDTDQFGTFAGDIPRTLSPRMAATVKARLGIQSTGLSCALASEGSFGSTLLGVDTTEILVFLDEARGLEIVEQTSGSSALPAARRVETVGDALAYAATIGFPEQGVLVHARRGGRVVTHKTIGSATALGDLVEVGLAEGMTLTVLPDHRAHRSPARADRIRALCDRMARRLATPCPSCGTPGYGLVEVERGLPCSLCGSPTALVAAEIDGCGSCPQRDRRPRAERSADPAFCDYCNP